MAALKSISLELDGVEGRLALISSDDSVWMVINLKWYDIATLLWYFLTPSDKRAKIKLRLFNGAEVWAYAIRIAPKHARIRGRFT